MLSWNVEGLKNCFDDEDFLNLVNNFHILFFSETWQRKNDSFELDGYECVAVPRSESLTDRCKRGHGGVCLFIRNDIKEGVEILEKNKAGSIWVKICKQFFHLQDNIIMSFNYIPPKDSKYYKMNDIDYFELLEAGIRKYSMLGNVSVVGDLNARCGTKSDIITDGHIFDKYIPAVDSNNEQDEYVVTSLRSTMDTVCNSSGSKLIDICLSSDLKIVNGRLGDDSGVGQVTYMSPNGQSLIDYVLLSQSLFPLVKDFVVHDFYSCSTHAAIQLNLEVNYDQSGHVDEFYKYKQIVWDDDKVNDFKETLNSNVEQLNCIVDQITNSDLNINKGIDNFADTLYNATFSVFGQTKHFRRVKPDRTRKFKSPWFTPDCEIARRELKSANRAYRRLKSHDNRNTVMVKRRQYCKAKRKARFEFKQSQKNTLHVLAKDQPRKFWSEIRKLRGKNNNKSNVTAADFLKHFKNLFSSDDQFINNEIENDLSQEGFNQNLVEELDINFNENEVLSAIKSLKRGKSSGIDMLNSEIFMEGREILAPILCRLFNFMFDNSIYPESWTKGLIVPVPKKGNLNDVNNYRGITLTSIFSKIFSLLLDVRIRKWAEKNKLLSDYQFGFRPNRSTSDCIYVLHSIINKVIMSENRKIYCAFVDFRKAFDLIYRNGIWYKLIIYGVSSKMVNMLKAIYKSVKSCVKVKGSLSQYFNSYMGVKQGEPLSPLLFIFFINDMANYLYDDNADLVTIDELQIFLLLFADDTVLFSYTKEGLQILVDKLRDYCNKWGIYVNTEKTVVMVFKRGTRPDSVDVYYGNEKLNNVTKFTYLGVTLSFNGKFFQAQKSLSEQAIKALFTLNSLFDVVSLDVSEKIKLFDSMVLPILNYASEIWGFHPSPDVERVHLKFLKQILGVRTSTSSAAVYGEFGRVPLIVLRKVRILKYWYSIMKDEDSLRFKVLQYQILHDNNRNNWANQVKNLICDLGYNYLWNNREITNLQLQCMIRTVYDQYLQSWFSELRNSSKLSTYNQIKHIFEQEKYLNCVKNIQHRNALSRFRCSAHRLNIEEGRYRNLEREQRICMKCNMNTLENEYHFLLVCPYYRELRSEILPRYFCTWPSQQKFTKLLGSEQTSVILKLAKFVHMANVKRDNT